MRIVYNFASRSRPEKFFACLNNIREMAMHDDYVIIATLDVDDETMTTPEVKNKLKEYSNVIPYYGFSKNKIDAINKNIPFFPPADIILNHSDDFYFTKKGYDLDILEAFQDFNGLVHFPDQKVGSKLITYAMMHREYLDIDGWIYHPEFESVYADNLQHSLAKRRRLYKFVDKPIFEHRHHIWGYGPADELLKKTEDPNVYKKDHQTFLRLSKEYSL